MKEESFIQQFRKLKVYLHILLVKAKTEELLLFLIIAIIKNVVAIQETVVVMVADAKEDRSMFLKLQKSQENKKLTLLHLHAMVKLNQST